MRKILPFIRYQPLLTSCFVYLLVACSQHTQSAPNATHKPAFVDLPAITLARNPFYPNVNQTDRVYFAQAPTKRLNYLGFINMAQKNTEDTKAIIAYQNEQIIATVEDSVADALLLAISSTHLLLQERSGNVVSLPLQVQF